MKVVLYSRVFPPAVGGTERFAEDLVRELVRRDVEVVVATRTRASGGEDGRCPWETLRRPTPARLRRALRWADAVHVNGLSLRGLLANSLARGGPTVVTHHGHQAICPTGLAWTRDGTCTAGPGQPGPCKRCPRRNPIGSLAVRAHRLGAATARRNVAVSAYLARRLDVPGCTVIRNPVGGRAFTSAEPGRGQPDLVAFAGRLVEEKGLDLLLRALVHLPDVRLEVAGSGPLRAASTALADGLDVASRVRFLGTLDFAGVADLYARAAVVCVPSLWDEPFGYAAAEAMAMGRPVAATPSGALRELLDDGRGYVAASRRPADLAASLEVALDDEQSRRDVAERARSFAEDHLRAEVAAEAYLGLYREIAA